MQPIILCPKCGATALLELKEERQWIYCACGFVGLPLKAKSLEEFRDARKVIKGKPFENNIVSLTLKKVNRLNKGKFQA